jgi:hypothetical protein
VIGRTTGAGGTVGRLEALKQCPALTPPWPWIRCGAMAGGESGQASAHQRVCKGHGERASFYAPAGSNGLKIRRCNVRRGCPVSPFDGRGAPIVM